MKYISYWANKTIYIVSIFLITLFIKDNILTITNKKIQKIKNGETILEDCYKYLLTEDNNYYFICGFLLLLLFFTVVCFEKNIDSKVKREKFILGITIYLTLFLEKIIITFYKINNSNEFQNYKALKLEYQILIFYPIILGLLFKNICLKKIEELPKEKTNFKSRKPSENALNYYLKSGAKSILISGDWGSGKTHLIEVCLKDKYIPVWIKSTLYENRRDIKKYIFQELKYILEKNYIISNPVNDLIKKFELVSNNSCFNFSKFNSSVEDDFSAIKSSLAELDKKEIILVLDDLERITNKKMIKEIISCIAEIEDSISIKILILANVEQLKKLKIMDFLDKYYDVHISLSEITIDEIVEEFIQKEEKEFIIKFFKEIINNLNKNDDDKKIKEKIKNPRFIKRISYDLFEGDIKLKENIFKLYAKITYHLMLRVFCHEDILTKKEEYIQKLYDITDKILINYSETKIKKYSKLNFTLASFKEMLKLIPIYVERDLNEIFESEDRELLLKESDNLLKIGKYEDCIKLLNKIIESNLENSEVYFLRAEANSNLGNDLEALENYNKAIILDNKNENSYNNRAIIYEKLKKYNLALEDYSEAINLAKDDPIIYSNRGDLHMKMQEYNLADKDLDKAIGLNYDNNGTWYNKGIIFYIKNDYQKAIEFFRLAIDSSPLDPKGKKIEEIIKITEKLEEEKNDNERVKLFYENGNLFKLLEDYNIALLNYEKAKEIQNFQEAMSGSQHDFTIDKAIDELKKLMST